MLSLTSNPYDPFDDYINWSKFDRNEGFDTAGFLARVVSDSSSLSDADQELAIEQAVESILMNPSFAGLYKRVDRKKQ